MTSDEIQEKVQHLVKNLNKDSFIYDLLRAYGISKTSITRLQKGDFNLAKNDGEILYKKKLFFKETDSDNLMALVDDLSRKENLKHTPRFVIATNYKDIASKDIKTNKNLHVPLKQLPKNHSFFLPWAGQEVYQSSNENEADRKASYRMAKLYDILIEKNSSILDNGVHDLNLFFSRLLFCFFAEDTYIFPIEGMFTNTLMQHTQKDGSDVHLFLDKLFKALNTKDNSRKESYINQFPYVNGGLFQDDIRIPKFNKEARNILEDSGILFWSKINPDIFGSMIQAVVNPDQRGNLGMHYTSVPNIMKVIKPLFLDDLYDSLEKAKGDSKKLRQLLKRISQLKIFDPACGSGNFLIIAYKELRMLEIEIWEAILDIEDQKSFIYTRIHLTQFYGIEIDDFAHEIAKLSLWLAEHQMNKYFESELEQGKSNPILPLKSSGNITHANATRIDWEKVCPKEKNDEIYLLGNPPYLGSRNQDKEQKEDLKALFYRDYKSLDYVTAWFYKGANYIRRVNAELAFVSTNSICQGDLVAKTWPRILNDDVEIGFAYQSFKWKNSAKRNAGVTVIIVSLRNVSNNDKFIFIDDLKKSAKNINNYLVDSDKIIVKSHNKSISGFPKMNFGNMPADGGNLILTENEKNKLIKDEPDSEIFIEECIGAHEFLKGKNRYCLWFDSEDDTHDMPLVQEIIDKVKNTRLSSSRPFLAETPHLFAQITQPPNENFILIPRVSSEKREYIPIGFFSYDKVSLDSCLIVASQKPWIFGILTSKMHMAWVRAVGGQLETRLRYSAKICYNTFPFPEISKVKKANIEENVFAVLEEREKHPEKTMSELYDPDKMPTGLRQAHKDLDEAVERCYRLQPFDNDTQRLEYLFKEYEKLIKKDTLFQKQKKGRKKKKK